MRITLDYLATFIGATLRDTLCSRLTSCSHLQSSSSHSRGTISRENTATQQALSFCKRHRWFPKEYEEGNESVSPQFFHCLLAAQHLVAGRTWEEKRPQSQPQRRGPESLQVAAVPLSHSHASLFVLHRRPLSHKLPGLVRGAAAGRPRC